MRYSVREYTHTNYITVGEPTRVKAIAIAVRESAHKRTDWPIVVELWDGDTNVGIQYMYYNGQPIPLDLT